MSRGLSRQQVEIMAEIERTLQRALEGYNQLVKSKFVHSGPTKFDPFDPWITPKRVTHNLSHGVVVPGRKSTPATRRGTASVDSSHLRSVERAMVSLARRGLLVRAEHGMTHEVGWPYWSPRWPGRRRLSLVGRYTTPKAAAKWRRQRQRLGRTHAG